MHLGVSIVMGVPPVLIHFNGIFSYKPSSYGGTPIYGNLHLELQNIETSANLAPHLALQICREVPRRRRRSGFAAECTGPHDFVEKLCGEVGEVHDVMITDSDLQVSICFPEPSVIYFS